jgi:hypothetical protein
MQNPAEKRRHITMNADRHLTVDDARHALVDAGSRDA